MGENDPRRYSNAFLYRFGSISTKFQPEPPIPGPFQTIFEFLRFLGIIREPFFDKYVGQPSADTDMGQPSADTDMGQPWADTDMSQPWADIDMSQPWADTDMGQSFRFDKDFFAKY